MRRWLLIGATGFSALLCVSLVAVWTGSYHRHLWCGRQALEGGTSFNVERGWISVAVWTNAENLPSMRPARYGSDECFPLFLRPHDWDWQIRKLDPPIFSIESLDDGSIRAWPPVFIWRREGMTSVSLQGWMVWLMAGLLPGVRVAGSWRRRRRAKAGRCWNCGYDLRASREICPECGQKTKGTHL